MRYKAKRIRPPFPSMMSASETYSYATRMGTPKLDISRRRPYHSLTSRMYSSRKDNCWCCREGHHVTCLIREAKTSTSPQSSQGLTVSTKPACSLYQLPTMQPFIEMYDGTLSCPPFIYPMPFINGFCDARASITRMSRFYRSNR